MHRVHLSACVSIVVSCFGPGIALAGHNGDYNGDGFDDLAIGVPFEAIDDIARAGAATQLFGTASRLTADRDEYRHHDRAGLADHRDLSDAFGSALAQGDFDGDGFTDLAVGAPGEDFIGAPVRPNIIDHGAVHVLYGSADGLRAHNAQLFSQRTEGIPNVAENGDFFGATLTSGDFDGDGFDDLAIGVPFEKLDGVEAAGVAHVLYGSPAGLKISGDQFWHRGLGAVPGDLGENDRFGASLAAGDFDGDGFDDVAIGAFGSTVNGMQTAGSATVLYGSMQGLRAGGAQSWDQDSPGIEDQPEMNDSFGYALVTNDFDGDGFDDRAIGAPSEEISGFAGAGAAHIIFGSGNGLVAADSQFWHQASDGIADDVGADDLFSDALAAGDFDDDGFGDLAIGVPGEDRSRTSAAGAVHVLRGGPQGLRTNGARFFTQSSNGIDDHPEPNENFGRGLTAGDFDNDGFDDLVLGVARETISGEPGAGAIHVLYGSSDGPRNIGSQFWHQDKPGVKDHTEAGDRFGNPLGR